MKTPPHSKEAEEAVIGSVLIDPSVMNDIVEIVSWEDFYFPKNQAIFKAIEEEWDEERLAAEAERLGRALLEPAIEAVRRAMLGRPVAEEFHLTFASLEELEEFTAHAAALGVPVSVVRIERGEGSVRALFVKHKRSEEEIKKILRTGLSPLD